jgi:hypothetical protein
MKTIVVTLQHENWEDDGGEHDPFVTSVNDYDYKALMECNTLKMSDDEGDDSDEAKLIERLREGAFEPVYPLQVDNVFTIWYEY